MHADKREEIDTAERRRHRRGHGHRLRQRRHLLQRARSYCTLENMFVAEPVIKMSITPLSARQRRQARQGPAAVPQGRPDVPRLHRRRDGRDGHRRHGRAAPGDLRRADPPRVRRRGRGRRPQGQLPRERPRWPTPSTTSTRSRPAARVSTATSSARCRPMTDEDREEAEGKELLFSDNVTGGRIPKNFIPAVEKGFRRDDGQGPGGRLPGGGRARSTWTTARTTTSTSSRHGVQAHRAGVLPRELRQDEAGAAGADHDDRDRVPRVVPGSGGRRGDAASAA